MERIDGVEIIKLKTIKGSLGKVKKMLSVTDKHFKQFGEIYFSEVKYGKVKGWGLHKRMTLNLSCISGKIKIVLYDGRMKSKTRRNFFEIILDENNYNLLIVPPGIWMGFSGLSKKESNILANCATLPHDDNEKLSLDIKSDKIPYKWD